MYRLYFFIAVSHSNSNNNEVIEKYWVSLFQGVRGTSIDCDNIQGTGPSSWPEHATVGAWPESHIPGPQSSHNPTREHGILDLLRNWCSRPRPWQNWTFELLRYVYKYRFAWDWSDLIKFSKVDTGVVTIEFFVGPPEIIGNSFFQ